MADGAYEADGVREYISPETQDSWRLFAREFRGFSLTVREELPGISENALLLAWEIHWINTKLSQMVSRMDALIERIDLTNGDGDPPSTA